MESDKEKKLNLVIVSGLSGSGKSTAIRAFEDRGYFCIDNLPVDMIPVLVESVTASGTGIKNIVLGIDARELHSLSGFKDVSRKLKASGHGIDIIFLEAGIEVLIRRFSQTRRRHPLAGGDVRAALRKEKEILADFRETASRIIDTSRMNVHDLKRIAFNFIDAKSGKRTLSLTFLSFGYKHGIPMEADLVFDVRCLPNPYFDKDLRPLNGLDEKVYDYVMSFEESREMLRMIENFISFSLPLFEKEGKTYLTVAIGCTGGRHRSISIVRALEAFMKRELPEYEVFTRHIEIGNNQPVGQ